MNFLAKLYQRPIDFVDQLLDSITSYRLVLYSLLAVLGWAMLASLGHKVPGSWYAIALSSSALVIVCRLSGEFFSRVLNIARNFESDYITALILALIMNPATTGTGYTVLAGAGFAAIASKYLLTISRRHIFNPAAFGAVVAGLAFHQYASWWVGTMALFPLVLVGGVLIMHKMKRFWMTAFFFLVYGFFLHQQFDGASPLHTVWLAMSGTAVLFFAFVMLSEPLTSPDKLRNYAAYALVVGVAYGFGRLRLSPEEALLIGNVAAYALEHTKRLELSLAAIKKEASGLYSFAFAHQGTFDYDAGQYMEWTLPLRHSDNRGNRRYLTLSSSPTENMLEFTVRLPKNASHFKKALAAFKPGDKILASHLGGSFTLPSNTTQKLVFVAGGVGITPFRSMAKYLLDNQQTRDVQLLYCANSSAEFAFSAVFAQAKTIGLVTHYIDTSATPINPDVIAQSVVDYKQRLFYISGPYGFVKTVRQALLTLGVSPTSIKSDYFPGYG